MAEVLVVGLSVLCCFLAILPVVWIMIQDVPSSPSVPASNPTTCRLLK